MSRHMRVLHAVGVAGVALLMGAGATALGAQDHTIPLDEAQIFFEFNSSGQDLGIQVFLDGDEWRELEIVGPGGKKLLQVTGRGNVGFLGLTELFFESVEPGFDEMTFEEILALFPEGKYHFLGTTVNGHGTAGVATLTHDIPDGPVIVSPLPGELVDRNNTVIRWEPVTTPAGIQISNYQVIVEDGDRVLIADMPRSSTRMTVPKQFLRPGTEYDCEVLAKEVSGNQTITECSFQTL